MAPNPRRVGKRPAHHDSDDDPGVATEESVGDYESESSRRSQPRRRIDTEHSDSDEDEGPKFDPHAPNGVRNPRRASPAATFRDKFKPGSVIRVLVHDFCAYTKAEFFPGPYLNMVIGPNGTGKSTLVNAICLGLGYSPKLLNRGDNVNEFVKHGRPTASVEIELKAMPRDKENYIIKLRIRRDNNSQKFWLNGKEVPQKRVQTMVRNLNIQVDNLCQFLPQDRVAAFAGLGEVQLLDEMLRAAAPTEVINWHQCLKELYKDKAEVLKQVRSDNESLENQQNSLRNMQADVDRVRDREIAQHKVNLLRAAKTASTYRIVAERYRAAKEEKKKAAATVKRLEQENEPSLRAVKIQEAYRDQLKLAVDHRKSALREAERSADRLLNAVRQAEEEVGKQEAEIASQMDTFKKRKAAVRDCRGKITRLEAQRMNEPAKFDANEWTQKIRAEEHKSRELQGDIDDRNRKAQGINASLAARKEESEKLKGQIKALDTREGQQLMALRNIDSDAARAWDWLQDNKDKFEKEVFGPPLLTCSIKDEKFSDLVQAFIQPKDMVCFTAQTRADQAKLSHQFIEVMGLSVSLRTFTGSLDEFRSPGRAEDLGFDGFAIDYLDGPPLLLAQLCSSSQLHRAGVSLTELTPERYERVSSQDSVTSWVSGRTLYKKTIRREYGDAGRSTATREVRPARFWKQQGVDSGEKHELQQKHTRVSNEFKELYDQRSAIRQEVSDLLNERSELEQKVSELKEEKAALQGEYQKWKRIPHLIESENERLAQAQVEMRDAKREHHRLVGVRNEATAQFLQASLDHSKHIEVLRAAHKDWLDASIRLIEAASDVRGLEERSRAIIEQCEVERVKYAEAVRAVEHNKTEGNKLVAKIAELRAEFGDEFSPLSENKTPNDLQDEIAAEEERLGMISAVPQNTLQKYDTLKAAVAKLEKQLEAGRRKVETLASEIEELRERWEPRVDEIVGRVTEAFSYNFEQIGCAGEVRLHKDEDFEKWALHVMVSYRPQEGLIRLTATRQSGGERTVATAFFLLALQGSAQAPFRVVDEINQGMDPRNERMVHNRMVEIACREHNSQYFLVTPKLLTGLRYDEGMTVLCVASGTHMPERTEKLNFAKCLARQREVMAAAGA